MSIRSMLSFEVRAFDGDHSDQWKHWDRLVDKAKLNPSLRPGWQRAAYSALGDPLNRVSVLIALEAPDLPVGLLPYYRCFTKMLGLDVCVLNLGTNLMSYHAAIIAPGNESILLAQLLASQDDWDVFRAANVEVGSPTESAIHQVAAEHELPVQVLCGEDSPYLTITESWNEFLLGKHKKFRYKLRQRQESIARNPEFRLDDLWPKEKTEQLLKAMLHVEDRSWKADAGRAISTSCTELNYYRYLLPYLASQLGIVASVLYRRDAPVAYCLCAKHGQWIGNLKTSYDHEFSGMSPGAIVIDSCIRQAFDIGAAEFDFLGDMAPHKLQWTSASRRHADFYVFARRPKTRAIAAVKELKRFFASDTR